VQVAAAELNKPGAVNGDLFVSNNAYFAMVDTVAGTSGAKARGYKKDFKKLCSSSVHSSVSEGCAMLAFNFDAGDSRPISALYYQVPFLRPSAVAYCTITQALQRYYSPLALRRSRTRST
jgi:hypothetical protein